MMTRYFHINIILLTIVITGLGLGWGYATYDSVSPGPPGRDNMKTNSICLYEDSMSEECSEITLGQRMMAARSMVSESCEPLSISYKKIAFNRARVYSLEPLLVNAVITIESNWNPRARSRSGAIGLMQLMPATAREMGVRDPFNPTENIDGGVKYLRYLLDRFNGDLALALAAYNAGPGRIETYQGIPPFKETQQYVNRVLNLYNGYRIDSI